MKEYYHFFPTCPMCHEPHTSNALIEKNGETARCPICSSSFRLKIDLSPDRFPLTYLDVISKGNFDTSKYFSKLPLVWKTKPNIIEQSYLDWINQVEKGNFLITWPWRKTKFASILASTFLLESEKKQAIIISGDISTEPSPYINPNLNEVYDDVIYLENSNVVVDNSNLRTEMNRFDKNQVFIKKKVTYYSIHLLNLNFRDEFIIDESIVKVRHRIVEEMKSDYGEDAIRTIKSPSSIKTYNSKGIIDIVIREQEEYGSALHYRKEWLWTMLLNNDKFIRLKKRLPYEVITSDSDIKSLTFSQQLIFLSSNIDPDNIFMLVNKIKPKLLIFNNCDEFIKDKFFRGKRSWLLYKLLKENTDTIIILFSNDPSLRYLYNIEESEKNLPYNIICHTWDNDAIIEEIKKEKQEESLYPNPIFSRLTDIYNLTSLPNNEKIEIENLSQIDLISQIVMENVTDPTMFSEIRDYLKDLKRSPLLIKGDYTKSEIFKRTPITFDYLLSILNDSLKKEDFERVNIIFQKIFEITNKNQKNPILEKIIEKTNDLLVDDRNVLSIIVHKFDINGTSKTFRVKRTDRIDFKTTSSLFLGFISRERARYP